MEHNSILLPIYRINICLPNFSNVFSIFWENFYYIPKLWWKCEKWLCAYCGFIFNCKKSRAITYKNAALLLGSNYIYCRIKCSDKASYHARFCFRLNYSWKKSNKKITQTWLWEQDQGYFFIMEYLISISSQKTESLSKSIIANSQIFHNYKI